MISETVFKAYESVRKSGITNMFDVNTVIYLANQFGVKITKEQIIEIMKTYGELKEKYLKD